MSIHLFQVPPAQASHEEVAAHTVQWMGLEGRIDVNVDAKLFTLERLDSLTIPAGSTFSYRNADTDAAFIASYSDPRERESTSTGDIAEPLYDRWEDYRKDFHWYLPLAHLWGFHRGSGPWFKPVRGHAVWVPANQSAPWHGVACDMLFLPVINDLQIESGGERWNLGRRDLLYVPAGVPYRYANGEPTESVFLAVAGPIRDDMNSPYFKSDPGWPPRPDTPTFETETAPDGQVIQAGTLSKTQDE